MRIGIDIRPLQLEAYKEQKIATHLRGWLQAAQQLQTAFEFRLLYDPSLPLPNLTLSAPQWQMQPLQLPFSPLATTHTDLYIDQTNEFLFDSALEAFLLAHHIDLFHATCPFMAAAFVPRRLFHTRWIVTVHDLAPLRSSDPYLQRVSERRKRSLAQRLGSVVYAQRIQVYDQSTKNDLVKIAGVAPDKIDVVHDRQDQQLSPSTQWERTAAAVLDSYRQASQAPLHAVKPVLPAIMRKRRLRLAFWTPLNPAPTGIADYSEALLAELGNDAQVELFVDGYQPSNLPLFDSFAIFDARAYPYLSQKRPYDINIYQVGNNPLHRYMYEPLLNSPGIITLHDIHIYYFIHGVFMRSGRPKAFWQEVAYCHGEDVARWARKDYQRGEKHDYALSLNKRVIQASRGIIVHSQWAKEQVEQCEGAPPVCYIPHGTLILEEDGGHFGKLVRRFMRLPQDGFIFGLFGNIHPVKRVPVILKAFARVRQRCPNATLLIMGAIAPVNRSLLRHFPPDKKSAKAAGLYLELTYASHFRFLMAMQAVDVGLNLRYPTVGETSGTLSILLGQGKPAIVSSVGAYLEYPDSCCPKVPVNEEEEEVLYRHMLRLIEDKRAYQQASQAAREYSHDKSWAHCAQLYLDFAERLLQNSRSF